MAAEQCQLHIQLKTVEKKEFSNKT